jgi:hypothetical protein
MKVGVTGTQKKMTPNQYAAARMVLEQLHATELHHGDCVGADEQFHGLARELDLRVVVHPPDSDTKRAFCEGDEIRPVAPYLVRNSHIVTETEVLVATPYERTEQVRSGTWSTVRRGVTAGRRVIVVFPNGAIVEKRST